MDQIQGHLIFDVRAILLGSDPRGWEAIVSGLGITRWAGLNYRLAPSMDIEDQYGVLR